MSNKVFKLFAEKMGGHTAENYIGLPGDIFYDPNTGVLKVADGVTPGGHGTTETSPLESKFKGEWVYFARPDNQPNVVDRIADNLIIKRNPVEEGWGSIYNDWDDSNGSVNTPYGTLWNTNGWADFSDVRYRNYVDFTNTFYGGWETVKHEYVMYDTLNDKHYAVRFLTWDGGSNGSTGAFSYMRREINTDIYFDRLDTNDGGEAADNGDSIAEHLVINRANGGAIYNQGTGTIRTNYTFDPVTDFCDSITYNTSTYVVTITNPNPMSPLYAALQTMQVGDEMLIDFTGNGNTTSQTVVRAWNGTSFEIDWGPNAGVINPTILRLLVDSTDTLESGWNSYESPKNTLWNAEGYDDLSNLLDRQFILFGDLFNDEDLGTRICGKQLIMHDTIDDKYYAVQFTRWGQSYNNGGYDYPGFSYTRRLIDTTKLSSGLKFSDNTIQTTGYSYKNAAIIKKADRTDVNTRHLTADDIGKMVMFNDSNFNHLRIPLAGAIDFPVGTTVTIINRTGGDLHIALDTAPWNDGTIYGAGTADNSTSWILPDNGGGNIAVLVKIESQLGMGYYNNWMLSGSGIAVD